MKSLARITVILMVCLVSQVSFANSLDEYASNTTTDYILVNNLQLRCAEVLTKTELIENSSTLMVNEPIIVIETLLPNCGRARGIRINFNFHEEAFEGVEYF